MNSFIIPASEMSASCPACKHNAVPDTVRQNLIVGDKAICGWCGSEFLHQMELDIPAEVMTIVRSLVQHKLYMLVDPLSVQVPAGTAPATKSLRLEMIEGGSYFMSICNVQWTYIPADHRADISGAKRYQRHLIDGFVPESIHQAVQLVTNTDKNYNSVYSPMSVTMADVANGPSKILRLERKCWILDPKTLILNLKTMLRIRIEISWQLPYSHDSEKDSVFVPVSDEALAMKIMQEGLHELREVAELSKLQLFGERDKAENQAAQFARSGKGVSYLLSFRCNPYAIASAVVNDDHLAVNNNSGVPLTFGMVRRAFPSKDSFVIGDQVAEYMRHLDSRDVTLQTVKCQA